MLFKNMRYFTQMSIVALMRQFCLRTKRNGMSARQIRIFLRRSPIVCWPVTVLVYPGRVLEVTDWETKLFAQNFDPDDIVNIS